MDSPRKPPLLKQIMNNILWMFVFSWISCFFKDIYSLYTINKVTADTHERMIFHCEHSDEIRKDVSLFCDTAYSALQMGKPHFLIDKIFTNLPWCWGITCSEMYHRGFRDMWSTLGTIFLGIVSFTPVQTRIKGWWSKRREERRARKEQERITY